MVSLRLLPALLLVSLLPLWSWPVALAQDGTAEDAAAPAAAAAAAPAPLKCGVASTVFTSNTGTVQTALDAGIDFWWNWNVLPNFDVSQVTATAARAMHDKFVPMLWGQDLEPDYSFMADHEGDVMGYNEPDQYGPACCNCDGKQTYSAATSDGWLPIFFPATAVPYWQRTVNNLTMGTWPGPVPPGPSPPPGPPGPPPTPPPPTPPPPGPPLPSQCVVTSGTSLEGVAPIARTCAGLRLYDCCERIGQHTGAHAAVGFDGCCEYYASSGAPGVKHVANKTATLITTTTPAPPLSDPMGVRRIVSPAMAGGAVPLPGVDCSADPSKPGNSHFCHGWLSMFKRYAMNITCYNFDRQATNCWDVIGSIQIHA